MDSDLDTGLILVTGATGHIGTEVCRTLRAARREFLPVDRKTDATEGVFACDLRIKDQVARLFDINPIRRVIHLAGILPSAFCSDPLAGAAVNLGGSIELLRQAVNARVKRFVFASSMGVYGSGSTIRPLTENDPPAPDEPYGGSKRAVELIGEALAKIGPIEFASLRIARVVGRGIKKTSSPWRSEIFEASAERDSIRIPFAANAKLSLVHVEDVARMLALLVSTRDVREPVYNTPAETWEVGALKHILEQLVGIKVHLGRDGDHGGPLCDGSRFTREFEFQARGLRERLSELVLRRSA
jgi:nucleoside-diphosphate-sugar epimerase